MVLIETKYCGYVDMHEELQLFNIVLFSVPHGNNVKKIFLTRKFIF